jgi:hypothetical protein
MRTLACVARAMVVDAADTRRARARRIGVAHHRRRAANPVGPPAAPRSETYKLRLATHIHTHARTNKDKHARARSYRTLAPRKRLSSCPTLTTLMATVAHQRLTKKDSYNGGDCKRLSDRVSARPVGPRTRPLLRRRLAEKRSRSTGSGLVLAHRRVLIGIRGRGKGGRPARVGSEGRRAERDVDRGQLARVHGRTDLGPRQCRVPGRPPPPSVPFSRQYAHPYTHAPVIIIHKAHLEIGHSAVATERCAVRHLQAERGKAYAR